MMARSDRVDRRTVLQGLSFLAAGAGFGVAGGGPFARVGRAAEPPGLLDNLRAVPNPRPQTVVILGAGIAGLVAAYELEKRGHHCVILEAARGHVGGRVRTLDLGDGLTGEAGAMRIPGGHALTRHYIAELGLSLRPFIMGNPNAYLYARGRRVRAAAVRQLAPLYDLRPNEQGLAPDDIWGDTVTAAAEGLTPAERANLHADRLTEPGLLALDRMTLGALFYQAGFSDEAIAYMAAAYGLESVLHQSVLEYVREEVDGVWTHRFDEIIGGTAQLTKGLLARLQARPRMGCDVIGLARDDASDRVTAVYRSGGTVDQQSGDFILCTIPFSVLAGMVALPVSPGKARAIRTLNYDPAIKVFARCRHRVWETDDGIFGGGSFSDLPLASTYYPADNAIARDPAVSAVPAAMIAAYAWGTAASRLGRMPVPERHGTVRAALARLHPQTGEPGLVDSLRSWDWTSYRWSRGGYAFFLPGQQGALHADIVRPEGRIHFAGEHASLDHSWLQGSIASTLRAVTAMLTQAGSVGAGK